MVIKRRKDAIGLTSKNILKVMKKIKEKMIIGIDFDNTIINYTKSFIDLSEKRNLFQKEIIKIKFQLEII